jgi:hypothetical protein
MSDTRGFIADRATGLAAAAVLFALGVLAVLFRMGDVWSDGAILALIGGTAVIIFGLGLLGPLAVDRPTSETSVLLVTGLLLALPGLLQLAVVLGVDDPLAGSGTLTWVFAAWTACGLVATVGRGSAIGGLFAALGATGVVLAGSDWLFDLSGLNTFRYLLAALTVVFFLAGLSASGGGSRRRHGVVLVGAAGLTALTLGTLLTLELFVNLFGSVATNLFSGGEETGSATISWGWELFQLVVGLGLIAFSARDREPGPGYLGVVVLSFFLIGAVVKIEANPSINGWPLALLIAGAVILVVTLRPRRRA